MSRALLLSVRPKWCAKMMNGDKTIEVRRGTALYKAIQKLIDENGYADIYVYCTKGKPYLGKKEIGRNFYNEPIYTYDLDYGETFKGNGNKKFYSSVGVYHINGKIAFKFRCYKVEEIRPNKDLSIMDSRSKELIRCANLSLFEGCEYLKWDIGCAIHISDLEIFDKPKELSEFEHYNLTEKSYRRFPHCDFNLTKAPQSFCYIEV